MLDYLQMQLQRARTRDFINQNFRDKLRDSLEKCGDLGLKIRAQCFGWKDLLREKGNREIRPRAQRCSECFTQELLRDSKTEGSYQRQRAR